MDIAVLPVLRIDTVTRQPINSSEMELDILFKIKNVADASKVHILFGTAQDIGDILTVQADVIENSGIYYLSYNGVLEPVNGYTAKTIVELTSQQETDYSFITLYVEDNTGQETLHLYFVK